MKNPSAEVVLLLGMHRSGTSLLMRICNLLGVKLAEDLIPPREDNAKGFFEHAEIVRLNEKIFECFGLNSQDTTVLPPVWWGHADILLLREAIKSCLQKTYHGMQLWGMKDPRIGKLLPLWLPLFEELNITPRVVIAFRNPLEVAASLKKREGLSVERGLLLWLQYNLAIEKETRGMPRIFIHYPDMMQQTEMITKRLNGFISGLHYDVKVKNAIHAFIDPALQHHKQGVASDLTLPQFINDIYQHMIGLSQNAEYSPGYFDEAQRISDVFTIPFQETVASLDPALHAWRDIVDVGGEERSELKRKVALLEQQLSVIKENNSFAFFAKLKKCIGV